jgi:hypothetical protein
MVRHVKPYRAQRKTLLAVGEGKAEVAFLKHLKQLYCSGGNGVAVTIRNAHGKGPGNVIATAIGASSSASYDKKVCLLDTDLEWTSENKHDAKRKKIELVGSTPCLEGLLLRILGKMVLRDSSACKQQLRDLTHKNMLEPEDYVDNFCYARLQSVRLSITELEAILGLYEGKRD